MAEAKRESFFWRWVWDAPILGENIIQPIFLLFPALCVIFMVELDEDSAALILFIAVVEILWLWALERFAHKRLVVPIIPIPWLWVFIALAGFSLLAVVGIVEGG